MYVFLNDISVSPTAATQTDSKQLLFGLFKVFDEFKQHKLETMRVPPDFHSVPLSGVGSHSVEELYQNVNDQNEKQLIINFLGNLAKSISHEDYRQLIENADVNSFDIYLDGKSSILLQEAYLVDLPVVSLRTKILFETDILRCEHYSIVDNNERTKEVSLVNFWQEGSHITHTQYLLEKSHSIAFAKTRWNPFEYPSWRTAVTAKIAEEHGYPAYRRNLSPRECRAKNMIVAIAILEANGWYWDANITRLNAHRQEVWRVYTNDLSRETVYISVDLVEGEFEIQNRRGKWENTLSFIGADTGKDYTGQNSHNINIR